MAPGRFGMAVALTLFLSAPSAPSADDDALHTLARAFFVAYASKDAAAFTLLWSPRSPDLEVRRQAVQGLAAAEGELLLNAVEVKQVTVAGDTATVRSRVDMTATGAGPARPSPLGPNRVLHLVKEGDAWRVWSDARPRRRRPRPFWPRPPSRHARRPSARAPSSTESQLRDAVLARANRLSTQRNYALARTGFELALKIARENGDALGTVLALNGSGGVDVEQDDYEAALDHYGQAVALARGLGDGLALARVLNNLGLAHAARGEYETALERYGEGLTLAEALGSQRGLAYLHANIGIVRTRQGNYVRALEEFEKALALNETLGSDQGVAEVLNSIGLVHAYQGDSGLALQFLEKSLALKEKLANQALVASTLGNIGMVHRLEGRLDQALAFYGRARDLDLKVGDKRGLAQILHNIGELNEYRGDYAEALANYEKALPLLEAVGNRDVLANTLNHLAQVRLAQKQFADALSLAERAAGIARSGGYGETLWEALTTQGLSERALGRSDRAHACFEEAIAGVEAVRSHLAGGQPEGGRFFARRLLPYEAMVDLLSAENRGAEALVYAERSRARMLLDILRSGRVRLTKAMTAEDQVTEERLSARLVALNTQISREGQRPAPDGARLAGLTASLAKARLEQEAFQSRLFAAHPELRTRRSEDPPIGMAEVGQLVPAGTVLMEYVVGDEATHLLVVTHGATRDSPRLTIHRLEIRRAELARRTGAFRERLARRDLAFAEEARALYDLLLGPARQTLAGQKRLVIVPDGPLWELPFQALQPSARHYVVEDQAVSYSPSLTALLQMGKARSRPDDGGRTTLLAFADPNFGSRAEPSRTLAGERLGPLPDAARQVRELERLYGTESSRVYVGADAREDRAKAEAGGYRILHFATHGILNDASPMYSQLVLARGKGGTEDGLLEAREILDLDLTADLAVLSACETARGRVAPGEGVVGLTWAFFVAGCPSTVVSQWKVQSDSTTALMVEFHRALRARRAKDESLRVAALKLLRDPRYRHPFYWAGFIVVGVAD